MLFPTRTENHATQCSDLCYEDTERRQHSHAAVLDLGLAPLLDVTGSGAVG